jgi:hypothetical protein
MFGDEDRSLSCSLCSLVHFNVSVRCLGNGVQLCIGCYVIVIEMKLFDIIYMCPNFC